MTVKSSIFSAFVLAMALTSCKKELEPQESSAPATAANAATPASGLPQTPQTVAAANPQAQVQPQQMQVQPQAQATAPGMNPPHGQPGHRCDIAVGAPLNQPAKMTASSPQAPSTITKITPTAAAPAKTAPGMNPPHGQAGHRCDIAVGAPLNSPVKTTSVQTASSPTGSPVTITPGVISSDGKVTPGTGVKVTTTNAPALLQDPNNKPAEAK